MNNNKIILYLTLFLLASCADYNTIKKSSVIEKKYYSSKGFALIYEEKLFIEKIIDKKIKDDDLLVVHNFLKKNTPIQLTNPSTSKVYNTKVYKS